MKSHRVFLSLYLTLTEYVKVVSIQHTLHHVKRVLQPPDEDWD